MQIFYFTLLVVVTGGKHYETIYGELMLEPIVSTEVLPLQTDM